MKPDAAGRTGDTLIVAVLAALFALVYGGACLAKYHNYLYGDFDLAIFAQATDGILRGTWFSSIRGMPWLGDHASLILFLVAPFYALHRSAETLLVIQTLALGAGAFAAHRLALGVTRDRGAALAFAALYLLYPALGYLDLFEFHPEALATAPLLFCIAFAREGRPRAALIAATLALLAREDVALVVLGIAALARFGRWRNAPASARALLIAALLSLLVNFGVLHPMFNAGGAEYGQVYAQWGATTGEQLRNLATHPLATLGALVSVPGDPLRTLAKLQLWGHLLLPLAFLPLLAPGALAVALPILFEHLLSWRTTQHTIYYQYTALLTPVFVAAAVFGYGRVGARGARRALLVLALGCAFASQWMFGPLLGHGVWQVLTPTEPTRATRFDRQRAADLDALLARVPAQGGVVAGFEFLARFAARADVHSLHHVLRGTYTFSTRPYPLPHDIDAVIANTSGRMLTLSIGDGSGERFRALLAANDLHPSAASGEAVLWTRDAHDTVELIGPGSATPIPLLMSAGRGLTLAGCDSLPASVVAGRPMTFRVTWRRVGPLESVPPMRLELIDTRGRTVASQTHVPGYGVWLPHEWPADTNVREALRFVLPDDLVPGIDTLAIDPGRAAGAAPDPARASGDGRLRLGVVQVLPAAGAR